MRRSINFKYGKKIVIAGMLAVFTLSAFSACGKDGNSTKVVFTTGFGKDEIFRIGSESCDKNEMMVYLTNTQNQYESVYGEEIWNTTLDGVTLEDNVKETVLAKIAQIKTMYLLAREKEITLDEEEESELGAAAQEYFQGLNETEVTDMDVTYDTIENLYREYAMANKVYQYIIQDINPEISDDEARTITVQHIFFRTVMSNGNGTTTSFSESDKQAAYQEAMEVRALAVDGEHDFAELASQYSDDSTVTYSFGKGEMDQAFEDAAFKLETDEVSGIVESEDGYHIIKCISTFNREETDANKQKIVAQRRNEAFGQEYDAFVATLARKLNQKLWNEVTLIHDRNVTTSDFFDVYNKHFPRN